MLSMDSDSQASSISALTRRAWVPAGDPSFHSCCRPPVVGGCRRAPFYLLDPEHLGMSPAEAAAKEGAATARRKVAATELPSVDPVVCGTVAVNRQGARVGKGGGFSDLEVAFLLEAGVIPSGAPSRTGHQASSGSIWGKTTSPRFQRWQLCQPATEKPRQSVNGFGRYNSSTFVKADPAGGRGPPQNLHIAA